MSLTYDLRVFILIIIVNTIITVIYIIFNLLRKKNRRNSFLLKSLVMLLCPIVGPVYIIISRLIIVVFFRKPVNLEDVIFSKERESILVNAEEEKERNLVPIEDAMLISGKEDSRALLLDVIKREPRKTLFSISLALDSPDSELSHYAASVIQSETAKIHRFVHETRTRILEIEEDLRKREGASDEKDRAKASDVPDETKAVDETGEPADSGENDGTTAPGENDGIAVFDGESHIRDMRKIRYRTDAGERFFARWLYMMRLSEPGFGSDLDYSNGERGAEVIDARELESYYADISEKLEESMDYSKHKDLAFKQGLMARDGHLDESKTILEELTDEMESAHKLISELDNIISQRVLSEYDTNHYLDILDEISKLVEKRDVLTEDELDRNVKLMLSAGRIESAAEWADKAAAWYPESLVSFSSRIRLCFARNDRDGFFSALEEMKQTDLQLDKEMLELVRFFV